VLVHDEGIAVIAIEAVSGSKPHEAQAILQNGSDVALGQTIVRGEMREFEVPHLSVAALGMDFLEMAGGGVRSPLPAKARARLRCKGIRSVNNAQK
jgi:hypothetical protein